MLFDYVSHLNSVQLDVICESITKKFKIKYQKEYLKLEGFCARIFRKRVGHCFKKIKNHYKKTREQILKDKELSECTFHPKISIFFGQKSYEGDIYLRLYDVQKYNY
jgi:hypothetical protein